MIQFSGSVLSVYCCVCNSLRHIKQTANYSYITYQADPVDQGNHDIPLDQVNLVDLALLSGQRHLYESTRITIVSC